MKIASSLKITKRSHWDSKLVRRRIRGVYVINKKIQSLKQDKNNFMDNENHKNTWNNFTSL